MIGHAVGDHMRINRFARLAIILSMVAAVFVVVPPADALPGTLVTPTDSAGAENPTNSGTYTLELLEVPSGDVTVTVSPDSQVTVDKSTLTFTVGNWNVPQTVTVTPVNDGVVEGTHPGTVSHLASGGGYDLVSIADYTITITDDDTASVTIVESSGSTAVSEAGATDTYTVVLDRQPSGTVTVSVNDDTQVNVNKSTLTFTTGNWNSPQTVTVSAQDDNIVEGPHTGTVTHSASGGGYNGVSIASVVATITDNDSKGVTVTPTTVSVSEAGTTDTYTVKLNSQPTGTVTVSVNDDTQVNVNKSTLTFTTGNWNSPQTVTVSAQDDNIAEGPHTGTVTHSASGGGYNGVSIASVVATITDNDSKGVTVTPTTVLVSEAGATDTYTVVLNSQPTGTVTVSVNDDTQVNVNTSTLTFTAGNWSVPQTVTVSAQNDNIVEGAHNGTVSHSASGGGYNGVSIASVVATITDNNFSVAFVGSASSLFEGDVGTSSPKTVTVVLDTKGRTLTAAATVNVVLTGGTATSGGPFSDFTFTSPTAVTFPAGSLDGAIRSVTIAVSGDDMNELGETVILGLQNPSTGGSVVAPTVYTLTILNDDVEPGLTVLDAVPVDEGPSAALKFNVILSPASGMTVTVKYTTANGTAVAPGDYTAITTPQTLTFLPGVTSQEVSVIIADDTLDEAAETVLVQLTDATNTTIAVDSGTGTIVDDDNVDPAITSLATTNATGTPSIDFTTGQPMKIVGVFTDPGVADTHTVTVDWGDSTTPTVTLLSPIGVRSFSPAHTYASAGFYKISVTITDADGGTITGARFITASGAAVTSGDTVGLVNPRNGIWRFFDDAGALVTRFYYGNPGDYPFMGDWDGDGIQTPGLYRQSDGYVYLRNSNSQGIADIKFFFGNPGDVPIAGDFNGDGFDTVSIYRPSNQTFYIINKLGSNDGGLGAAELSYVFGNPGDKPFVGDFDGDGIDTVGLHRESTGLVYFRNSHTQGNADHQFIYGDPGDQIVAGDWTDDGIDSPALYRSSDRWFYFRYTNTQGIADFSFYTDQRGWIPVAGLTGV